MSATVGWLIDHGEQITEPTRLVASLSPTTDPREPDDARNGEEDHRSDREPQVAVRSTGDHQNSAEYAQDDRDCETDPPEHGLQAAYSHRPTLAETRSAVEAVECNSDYEYEVTYSPASAPSIDGYRMRRSSGILPTLAVVAEWMRISQNPIAHRRTKAVPAGEWERIEIWPTEQGGNR